MRVFLRPCRGIVSPRNGPIKPCPIPRFHACMIVVPTTGGKEMNEVKEDVEARKAFYIHSYYSDLDPSDSDEGVGVARKRRIDEGHPVSTMRERTYAMALYCFRSPNETETERVLTLHRSLNETETERVPTATHEANPRDLIEGDFSTEKGTKCPFRQPKRRSDRGYQPI